MEVGLSLEGEIVENHALSPIESDTERPALPVDKLTLDLEARTLRLNDLERLDCRTSRVRLKVVRILGLERLAQLREK